MSDQARYDLRLQRLTPEDDDGIYGRLCVPEFRIDKQRIVRHFDTLELPFRGNKRNVSAIPTGRYKLVKQKWGFYYDSYKERWPHHEFVVNLAGVQGRDGILIHTGNEIDDSEGCILVGQRLSKREGDKWLSNSRNIYSIFYGIIDELWMMREELWIDVVDRPE